MKRPPGSECKDIKNRSKKDCVCGGHSQRDRKGNLSCAGTKTKVNRRAARILKMAKWNKTFPFLCDRPGQDGMQPGWDR